MVGSAIISKTQGFKQYETNKIISPHIRFFLNKNLNPNSPVIIEIGRRVKCLNLVIIEIILIIVIRNSSIGEEIIKKINFKNFIN